MNWIWLQLRRIRRIRRINRTNRINQQWRNILLVATTVAICAIAIKYTGGLQLLEWAIYDRFFCWRPGETADDRLLIVTVDESDIANLGEWPLSDALLAQVIQRIDRHQPAGIGLLFYRDLPVEPGHQTLVTVMKSTPNLIGVEKAIGEPVPPPPTLSQLNRVGIVDLLLDADSKVRRVLLSHPDPQGKLKLSIGAQLALNYLEDRGIYPKNIQQKGEKQLVQLGQVILAPFTGNDGGYVRSNAGGYQMLLNYRGGTEKFEQVSLTRLLNQEVKSEQITGRIVLIGSIATSLNELFYTPYSSQFAKTPKATPGVIIHANIVSQILSAALDGRPPIKVWSDWAEVCWVLGWSFLGAIAASVDLNPGYSHTRIWVELGKISLNLSLGSILLLGSSYLAFLSGWWLPVMPEAIAFTSSSIVLKIYQSLQGEQNSQKQLIQSLSALPVGVFVYNKSGLVYTNDLGKQLIGLPETLNLPDLPNISLAELVDRYQLYIADTDQPYPLEKLPLFRALNGETVMVDDIESQRQGQRILLESQGKPIFDRQGNVVYAIVTFQDITQRKQAEKILANYNHTLEEQIAQRTAALRESEQRFRQAFEYSAIGICLLSPSGKFLQVNHALCQILGYPKDELIERSCHDVSYPKHRELELALLEELLLGKRDAFWMEKRYLHKNGAIIWGSIGVSLVRDESNNPLYFIGQVQDVTQRKQAEQAVKYHEAQLNAVVSNTSDGLLILNHQGKICFANPAASQILHQSVDKLIDLEFGIPGNESTEIGLVLPGDRNQTVDKTVEMRTGECRWQGQSAYIVSLRDISDRKQAEIALQKAKLAAEVANRAKSTFLAQMTHELRTPLHAILGFAKIINRDADIQPEYREYLNIIIRSGQHLLELINQVLDTAKIESGEVTLNETCFDLVELLNSVKSLVELKARAKNLPLIFEVSADVPRLVETDGQKLRQVLINLVGNAIKFTQTGQAIVRVSTSIPSAQANNQTLYQTLYFEVEDTGPGIAAAELPKLFQPFVQTQTGRQTQEGTGLGLAISQQFIELMGGKITVISGDKLFVAGSSRVSSRVLEHDSPPNEVTRGTIFQFELPVKKVGQKVSQKVEKVSQKVEKVSQKVEKVSQKVGQKVGQKVEKVEKVGEDRNVLCSESFTVMSPEWIDQLDIAARSADRQWIFQLLEELRPANQPLADELVDLVHNFQIDRIIEIIVPLIK